jgi:hypothetical protein
LWEPIATGVAIITGVMVVVGCAQVEDRIPYLLATAGRPRLAQTRRIVWNDGQAKAVAGAVAIIISGAITSKKTPPDDVDQRAGANQESFYHWTREDKSQAGVQRTAIK